MRPLGLFQLHPWRAPTSRACGQRRSVRSRAGARPSAAGRGGRQGGGAPTHTPAPYLVVPTNLTTPLFLPLTVTFDPTGSAVCVARGQEHARGWGSGVQGGTAQESASPARRGGVRHAATRSTANVLTQGHSTKRSARRCCRPVHSSRSSSRSRASRRLSTHLRLLDLGGGCSRRHGGFPEARDLRYTTGSETTGRHGAAQTRPPQTRTATNSGPACVMLPRRICLSSSHREKRITTNTLAHGRACVHARSGIATRAAPAIRALGPSRTQHGPSCPAGPPTQEVARREPLQGHGQDAPLCRHFPEWRPRTLATAHFVWGPPTPPPRPGSYHHPLASPRAG